MANLKDFNLKLNKNLTKISYAYFKPIYIIIDNEKNICFKSYFIDNEDNKTFKAVDGVLYYRETNEIVEEIYKGR